MQSLANKTQSDYFYANGSRGLNISKKGLWTPAQLTTSLWLDANDSSTITISTGVSQWNDKSGNGRNATQATGANQPLVISAALNGLNVLRFDGSNDLLNYDGSFFVNTSYMVFSVVTRRSNRTFNFYMGGTTTSNNNNLILGWTSPSTLHEFAQYGTSFAATVESYTSPIPDLWVGWLDTSVGRRQRRNGTQVATSGTTTQLSGNGGSSIGRFFDVSNSYYDGDVAEIIATTSVLTLSNIQLVEGYLAWKWGLVASLPADHPYKNAAPTL